MGCFKSTDSKGDPKFSDVNIETKRPTPHPDTTNPVRKLTTPSTTNPGPTTLNNPINTNDPPASYNIRCLV